MEWNLVSTVELIIDNMGEKLLLIYHRKKMVAFSLRKHPLQEALFYDS